MNHQHSVGDSVYKEKCPFDETKRIKLSSFSFTGTRFVMVGTEKIEDPVWLHATRTPVKVDESVDILGL